MQALIALAVSLFAPLDGKKTYLGGALLGGAAFIHAVFPQYAAVADVLSQLGTALSVVGIGHKIEKATADPAAPATVPAA